MGPVCIRQPCALCDRPFAATRASRLEQEAEELEWLATEGICMLLPDKPLAASKR